jgi:hypothetical protein
MRKNVKNNIFTNGYNILFQNRSAIFTPGSGSATLLQDGGVTENKQTRKKRGPKNGKSED